MDSITCPECRNLISEFDLSCTNCGFSLTPEVVAKLKREQEVHGHSNFSEVGSDSSKTHRKYEVQTKLNKFSLGFFKVNFTTIVVPVIIVMLIIIVIILMLL